MSDHHRPVPRVLVATVTAYKSRTLEELARVVSEEMGAHFTLARSVIVKSEILFIRELVSTVATANEADAIVLIGGTGIGPFDGTCEAIDAMVDRRLEGFGEAYRDLLREEFALGPRALLARATAGVYNQCVVYALSGQPAQVRRAVATLVVPTLPEAVELTTGRMRTHVSMGGIPSERPRPIEKR